MAAPDPAPSRGPQWWSLAVPTCALILALVATAADAPRPLPLSAHNCYPTNGTGAAMLENALALGVDNIEIDLGWDAARRVVIVGHDAAPRSGTAYPEFETYLVPALERHWETPRADGAPSVLTLDWKTAEPDAVRAVKAFLDARPDWFSSAPRAEVSPLSTRRLTVCFTGSDAAKAAYDAMVAPGEPYRAFRDAVYGAGGKALDDVDAYGPPRATAYHRFLTFHWGHVEPGAPARAGAWEPAEAARLKALMAGAHRRGFRVRIYCVNGRTGPPILSPYRFADASAAAIRWRAAADAGVDWVATDEVDAAAAALRGP
jgi:hypothetical protein